jgi:hypothetical protein
MVTATMMHWILALSKNNIKKYMIFKKKSHWFFAAAVLLLLTISFIISSRQSSHQQMTGILKKLAKRNFIFLNPLTPEANLTHDDSILHIKGNEGNMRLLVEKAQLLLQTGHEE